MAKNNAKLYDPNTLIQAGINPLTGEPLSRGCSNLKGAIKEQLKTLDELDAINRYTWFNLPKGLTPQLIERVLYYKGQGILFRLEDTYYFLPYCLAGSIDVYGRYKEVTPLPFNGTSGDGKDEPWIQGLTFKPVYEPPQLTDYMDKSVEELQSIVDQSCVILWDHTPGLSQLNTAKAVTQDGIIDVMSDCFPFMRTALLNSTGILGMKVGQDSEVAAVKAASSAINNAALTGEKYVPIRGTVEFQELTGGECAKAEEFLLAMQSLDNFRLSQYGLETGGLFQKKSHMLEAEQKMNAGNASLALLDGLLNRQDFAITVNTIFGETIWCDLSEPVLGVDRDGDGLASGDSTFTKTQTTEEDLNETNE